MEVINRYSLLYTIKGKKKDDKVLPFLLAAHLDVVPVANGTWKLAEPFDGHIVDDVVYGRGALDDKCSVMVKFLIKLFFTMQSFEICGVIITRDIN